MLKKKIFIFLCILSFILIGISSAFAHDGTVGSAGSPIIFDLTPQEFTHNDADPWKGFFMIYTTNNSTSTWTGFDFMLSGSDVVFIDDSLWDPSHPGNECSTWAFDGSCDPVSSNSVSSWTISPNQKKMSVFTTTSVAPGETVWYRVYTDNTASMGDFKIKGSPIVPEPVSSTLFILGAATLAVRRFVKKKNS